MVTAYSKVRKSISKKVRDALETENDRDIIFEN